MNSPGSRISKNLVLMPAAWDRLAATPEALFAMETAAAVCFGSLAQRRSEARQAIQRLVTATPRAA